MKILVAFCALLVVSEAIDSAQLVRQEWKLFKLQYGKQYLDQNEDNYRLNVYLNNRDYIAKHNEKYERGEVTFKMGMNLFGDLTHQEFRARSPSINHTLHQKETTGRMYKYSESSAAPESKDWRSEGAVTPIKYEGQCVMHSWAFSTAGAIEGLHFIQTKNLVPLSEQNLIDCVGSYPPSQCVNSSPYAAFHYVINNQGIETEEAYPYQDRVQSCRYDVEYKGATIKDVVQIITGNEIQLQSAVGEFSPVSVLVDTSPRSMQFYTEGVYYDKNCNSNYYDYSALVVGYGIEAGQDFWLLKFSRSASWGDHGYIKIARNKDNHCGVATAACYPV